MMPESKAVFHEPASNRGKTASKQYLHVAIIQSFLQILERLLVWLRCSDIRPGIVYFIVGNGGVRHG